MHAIKLVEAISLLPSHAEFAGGHSSCESAREVVANGHFIPIGSTSQNHYRMNSHEHARTILFRVVSVKHCFDLVCLQQILQRFQPSKIGSLGGWSLVDSLLEVCNGSGCSCGGDHFG